jgi:hypothetical protein
MAFGLTIMTMLFAFVWGLIISFNSVNYKKMTDCENAVFVFIHIASIIFMIAALFTLDLIINKG